MATCDNYMIGNTPVLLRAKEAAPRILDSHFSKLLLFKVSGFREKGRQTAAILFCLYLNGNAE
jgi:hypothetical protein